MKIIILKEKLKEGIVAVSRAISRNLSLPVLSGVLLLTEKNTLSLSSTDLEMGINWKSLAKVEDQGSLVVPFSVLSGLVNLIPEEQITLRKKEDSLFLETKSVKTQIQGFSSKEFPLLPEPKNNASFFIPAISFCNALNQVVDISGISTTRPEISGILLIFERNQIKLAATDSFRLAEKTFIPTKPLEIENKYSLIIPHKTAKEIIGILGEKKEQKAGVKDLQIWIDPGQITIEASENGTPNTKIKIVSRLIDGEFPDYQEIIPKKYKTHAIVDRVSFVNGIKTASLFCGKTNEVNLRINPKAASVDILSKSPDVGHHTSSLKSNIKGEDGSVSFNYRLQLDGLVKIKSAEVFLGISERNGEAGPGVVKPVGDQSYLYVLMPLQTT